MKMKIILIAMLALPLLMGVSCKKENSIQFKEVSVDYKRCKNSENYAITSNIEKKNVLIFDLHKINEDDILKMLNPSMDIIEYILYDASSSVSNDYKITYKKIRLKDNNIGNEYGTFCNFPIGINELNNIPKMGVYISFSADIIHTKFTTDAIFTNYDIVLKSLKIQIP